MSKRIITRISAFVFACLSIGLSQQSTLAQTATIEDEHYLTACGPIACFVALQTLGVETSLSEMVRRSNWQKGRLTPVEDLQNGLNSYRGISSQIAKLSPQQLCSLLQDDGTVVILATRKKTDDIDHAVCAVGIDENNQVIHVIDYPELHRNLLIGEVADRWDGAALVVRFSPFYRAMDKFGLVFTPLVLVVLGILWFRNRGARGANRRSNRAKEASISDSR